jgi:hypothetical protein
MTPSNVSGITTPVPSSEDYTAPVNSRSRIAEKWARMPRVDQNGKTVATQAETNVVDTVPTPVRPPTMVDALIEAAKAVGADPARLGDSEALMRSVGAISPADSDGLQGAVLDAMAANPSLAVAHAVPGMRPNPAQGSSGNGFQPKAPQSTLERLHEQAAKQMGRPIPPGSVV